MTDSKMLDFSSSPELQEALNQWPGQPQVALERIRSLADAGEESLAPLVAWMYTQVGSWNEGLPYARKAADRGIAWALSPYMGNLLGAPEHHDDLLRFVSVQLDAGWSVEPVGWVPQLLQQGNQETAWKLLELAGRPAPGGARGQWDDLMKSSKAALEGIQGAASKVGTEESRIIDQMNDDGNRVEAERMRAEKLVAEVADLANEGASQHLAKEYEKQAETVEETAQTYTRWSIALGAIAAVAACVIAYLAFTKEHGAGAVLSKAALALPVLAFAGYVGRLAAIHRKQAWRWRHIELQIRTANPFVSPLEDDQRKLLIAALALRFFPGQRHDAEADAGGETVDPVALLAQLLPGDDTVRRAQKSLPDEPDPAPA